MSIYSDHCRDHFYREFAFKTIAGIDKPGKDGSLPESRRLRTTPIKNNEQLNYIIKKYGDRPGEYLSVYPFASLIKAGDTNSKGEPYKEYLIQKAVNYYSAKINRIYFDFDCEYNPQLALNDAILVMRELSRRRIFCHCYFSGSKGIAMYIEFKTMEVQPENKKEVIAGFFDLVKEMIGEKYEIFCGAVIPLLFKAFSHYLPTLDKAIRGDIARVSRIPNTKHKSGLFCIPISAGDMYRGIEHIKRLAKEPQEVDLESIITKNMMRNTKMNIIIKNLEKQVIADRAQNKETEEIKKAQLERYKKAHKTRPGAINDELLQKVRAISISEIIGTSADRIKCPIHGGDNPTSLQIDHNKNLWHCYSCQKGGDGITYLMELKGIDFKTAVKQLAEA